MTEAAILQEGRDLIATEIMGWKQKACFTSHIHHGCIWVNPDGHWIANDQVFLPDQDAEQSDAVLDKLLELGWNSKIWRRRDEGSCCCLFHTNYYNVSADDALARMAIFKASVKAAEWIRDNQEVKE